MPAQSNAGGLAAAPLLGPVAAPQVAIPNLLTDAAQEIGAFPQQQVDIQQKQTELQGEQLNLASQRLAVLTKMAQQNPQVLSDPNIVGAFQRAYKAMGISAPMTEVGGKPAIDAAAIGTYQPMHDFIAREWSTLSLMDPQDRQRLADAEGVGPLPDSVLQIQRKYLQSPAEATELIKAATTLVSSLGKPGGDVNNVSAALDMYAAPLKDIFGPNAEMVMVNQLKPVLSAQIMQTLQQNLLQARANNQQAQADKLTAELAKIPAEIAQINSKTELDSVMAKYYPETVAARTMNAEAAASRASTYASLAPSEIARNTADADKLSQDAANLRDAANDAKKYGLKNPVELLNNLQRQVTTAQTAYDKYLKYHQDALDAAQADGPTTPQGIQDMQDARTYNDMMQKAKTALTQAQSDYQSLHSNLMGAGATEPKPTVLHNTTPKGYPAYSTDGGKTWHYGTGP